MEKINNNVYSLYSGNSVSNVNKNIAADKSVSQKSDHPSASKQKLKEAATEMIKEMRVLGEWEDKKGLDQTTDPTLGGDIRYALTSKDIDFLKRLRWGNLTLGEFREVSHRIKELEQTMAKNSDVLSGKIIDAEA